MGATGIPPKSARVLIILGVGIFLAAGLAATVLAWTQGEPRLQVETLPAAVALGGTIALPGVVAAIGLRKHQPRLLWPAIVAGLLPAAVTILSVGLILVIPVLLFVQAALRWPVPRESRRWRTDLVPLFIPALVVVAGLTFFAHQDPACWDYSEDQRGRVSYVRAATHAGMESGWFIGGGVVTGLAIDSSDGHGTGTVCVSDRITPLEAGIALLLIGGAIGVAAQTARRTHIPTPTEP
jgi:hypothetical protein